MKILFVCSKPPYPPVDGGAIATYRLVSGLANLGHDITILSMNTLKHWVNYEKFPDEIKKSYDWNLVRIDTKIRPFKVFANLILSKLPYNLERFISIEFANELKLLIQKKEYDIIHFEGLFAAFYIEVAKYLSKAQIAFRPHNVEHEIWERKANHHRNVFVKKYLNLISKRLRHFEYKIINQYDLLIPITERDAKTFQKHGNHKPHIVLKAGFDFSELKKLQNIKVEHPSVFFIGALDWQPNIDGVMWFLKECWPEIKKCAANTKMYIAGRNADEEIRNFLNHLHVNFLGEIPNAYEFIASKSIMIVPLFSGGGMRVKIVEGMALGKAIVSTKIGAEGIGAGEKEISIANGREEFIHHVLQLIQNKDKCMEMGNLAKSFAIKHFDNLKLANDLSDFYLNHLTN